METPAEVRTRRAQTAMDGAITLIAVLVVLQIWTLTATLEATLGGRGGVELPGAAISGILFLACGALYTFIERVDRSRRA